MTRVFAAMLLPAVSGAVAAYFGYYAIWGTRGAMALADTQAELGVRQEELTELIAQRQRLEHRIALMKPGQVDPDLVEELARGELMNGAPNQVAVPRRPQH